MRHSHIIILCLGLILTGCSKKPTPPTLLATTSITAQLFAVPDMGIEGIENVDVPQEHIPKILKIVTPVTFIKDGVVPKLNYHVADVYLHHEDSKVTKIIVRFTGHNPAAVTIDGVNYFYASVEGPADGARELARLLATFHFEAQNNKKGSKGE